MMPKYPRQIAWAGQRITLKSPEEAMELATKLMSLGDIDQSAIVDLGPVKGPTASQLMSLDNRIWKRLNIESDGSMSPRYGGSAEKWNQYQDEVSKELRALGVSPKNKISERARTGLEDENYHSLNQAIDFLNLGEGRFGITKGQFFGRAGAGGREERML